MIFFKYAIVCITLCYIVANVRSLEWFPDVENVIAVTETIIRETVNKLFVAFRIKDIGNKTTLKDLSIIHNLFVSITLKDCENLKNIVRLSKVNFDNNTRHFIAQINEVLNEGDKNNEVTDDVNVNTYIEKFIRKLRELKESYKVNKNYANVSVNTQILNNVNKKGIILANAAYENSSVKYVEDSFLNDTEVWTPIQQSGRRIYQGHRTRIKNFPFVVSVQFFEKFQCAGSIIQKDLVITAASCLQLAWNNRFFRENPAFLSVQIGSNFYEGGGENIPVLEIYFHPEYSPKTLNNNLALLRLSVHIVFSKKHKNVKRIDFDRNPSPLPVNTDGILIIGWGARDSSNMVYDPWRNRLSFAELDYYPLFDCQEVYSRDYVTNKHFCAGYYSKPSGACQRDIGGPGVSGGRLVGVISFGPPICGTPDAPTVFTKVGFYKDWIDSILLRPAPSIRRPSTLRRPKITFAPQYLDTTKTTFFVTPFGTKAPPQSFDYARTLPENTLRILEDDNLFKEFLSTMFQSGEEELSVEPNDTIRYKNKENNNNDKRQGKPRVRKAKVTEVATEMITSTTHADYSEYEYVEDTETAKIKTLSSMDYATNVTEDDLKLEKEITDLLDDLDVQKLLESEELTTNVNVKENITSAEEKSEFKGLEIDIKKETKDSVQTSSYSSEKDSSDSSEGLGLIID